MSYSYQWLDVPWGDGDMGTYSAERCLFFRGVRNEGCVRFGICMWILPGGDRTIYTVAVSEERNPQENITA